MIKAEEQFEEFYLSLRGNHSMSYISCAFARFYAKQVAEQVLLDAALNLDSGVYGEQSDHQEAQSNIANTPIQLP